MQYGEQIIMKKTVLKTIAYFLIVISIILIPSVIIDPYNVFHSSNPRDNGIEANKGFIKTEYIKKHHDEFDSLLFGSSRAGFVDIAYLNEKMNAKFYDMASSESLVNEQVIELREFIASGFIPKKVIVMVDDISCFVNPEIHKNMLYRIPYPVSMVEKAEFYLKYMDLITNFESLSVINDTRAKKEENLARGIDDGYDNSTHMSYIDRFYHTGTERLDKESHFNPDEEQYQKGYWVDYYSLRADEAVSDMKDMVNLCEKYGIELIVVTNPLYKLTYQMDIENGYLIYLRKLAEVTDYYNFSSFNAVTENYSYYYETSHFMPEVTRMMVDAICENTRNNNTEMQNDVFGTYVTRDNADMLISLLEAQAAERGINIYSEP